MSRCWSPRMGPTTHQIPEGTATGSAKRAQETGQPDPITPRGLCEASTRGRDGQAASPPRVAAMSSGFPREAAVVLENGLRTRADDGDLARPTHESSDSTSHGRRPNLPYLIRFTSLVDACGRRGPSPMMPLLDPYWDRCHVLVRLVPGALLPDLEPPPGRCPRSWPGRATEATPARSCPRGPRGSTLQSPDRGSLSPGSVGTSSSTASGIQRTWAHRS